MSVEGPPSSGGGKLLRFRGPHPARGSGAPDQPSTAPASTIPPATGAGSGTEDVAPGTEPADAGARDFVFSGWHPGPFGTESLLPSTPERSRSAAEPAVRADSEATNVVSLLRRSSACGKGAGTGGPRTITLLGGLVRFKVAIAVTGAVVGLGGMTAAAYTGSLPRPAQEFAHSALGAPAPLARAGTPAWSEPATVPGTTRHQQRMAAAPPTSAAGPEVDGPAAYGLCRAFDRAIQNGDDVATAVAFRSLARAAGGASKVQAFCAAVPGPGAPASTSAPGSATGPAGPATDGRALPGQSPGPGQTLGETLGQTLARTGSSGPSSVTGTPSSGEAVSSTHATTSLDMQPTSTTVSATEPPRTTAVSSTETTTGPAATTSPGAQNGISDVGSTSVVVSPADLSDWATPDSDSYPGDPVRAATRQQR